MGRRVDRIIKHIRSITENDLNNSSTDIEDEEILEYINEAQHRIQSKILAVHPRVFVKETIIPVVSNQEEYDLPSDVYLGSKILSIEYSNDGGSNYFKLQAGYLRNRDLTDSTGSIPKYYIRRDKFDNSVGSFLVSPKSSDSNGQFRVTYVQRIDELDKRRGVVSAVTLDGSSNTITSLTLDTSGNPPIDSEDLDNHDYICIVGRSGNIKMSNILFNSINTTTGVVTIDSSFSYQSGETIEVGDFVVGGQDTTSHVKLPRNIERYLIQFAAFKIFKRDSSTDSNEQTSELLSIEQEIVDSFGEINDDLQEIAITEPWDEIEHY